MGELQLSSGPLLIIYNRLDPVVRFPHPASGSLVRSPSTAVVQYSAEWRESHLLIAQWLPHLPLPRFPRHPCPPALGTLDEGLKYMYTRSHSHILSHSRLRATQSPFLLLLLASLNRSTNNSSHSNSHNNSLNNSNDQPNVVELAMLVISVGQRRTGAMERDRLAGRARSGVRSASTAPNAQRFRSHKSKSSLDNLGLYVWCQSLLFHVTFFRSSSISLLPSSAILLTCLLLDTLRI